MVSRESSFLFNNLILLASCFAVLWGTLFPVISEAVSGEKITLDADWYNRLMIPIGLFLLFLTGVGPLFAWRRTSLESLRRNFQWPGIAALVLVGALLAAGMRHFYALISFGFCLFVALTVMMEFYKGARSIAAKNHMNLLRATVELTHRNTRRYGGYLVHMGIVLMFIGFTGHAFNQSRGQGTEHRRHHEDGRLRPEDGGSQQGENDELPVASRHHGGLRRTAMLLGTLEPEKRFYKASKQGTSEVGIRPRLNEDLYLNFGGMSDDNQRAVIQAYVFPLVSWIWIGGLVLIGGTLVCLVPSKIKMQYARTEVVGITKKHATIQKWPGIASLVLVGALMAAGMRQFYALISFGFCLFVALTVIMEFYKGARSIARQEPYEPAARHRGADAPQYPALRRVPGPHGDRADVRRASPATPSTRAK